MSAFEVRDLTVTYRARTGQIPALRGVDLTLDEGGKLGLLGESGAGKSSLGLALLRLLPPGTQVSGSIRVAGTDLAAADWGKLRTLRWAGASIIFQGAMHALNPVRRVGDQIDEPMLIHRHLGAAAIRRHTASLLTDVGLPLAVRRAYPHQLSGGERQRVMVAMALACSPRLVIADEPSTALDVIRQAQILGLITDLTTRNGSALLLISHDLPLLATTCDRIAVLHDGRIVEDDNPGQICSGGRHPHTRELVSAYPRIDGPRIRPVAPPAPPGGTPVLAVRDLRVAYPARRGRGGAAVIDGINLNLAAGEIVALVGESGCGKTTLARTVVGLHRPTGGEIHLAGQPLRHTARAMAEHRRHIQLVPQDPAAALNPRHTVYYAVAEGLRIHQGRATSDERDRVAAALFQVGLRPPADFFGRYPHELSGGQRQRILIAAALVLDPQVLVADEPVSSLDARVRAEIVALLLQLRAESGLSALILTHDLRLAWSLADRIAVMYLGRIVETGPAEELMRQPAHPYTAALLRAIPVPGVTLPPPLSGEPPDPANPPAGCRFHPRCPLLAAGTADAAGVGGACRTADPAPLPPASRVVACHYAHPPPGGAISGNLQRPRAATEAAGRKDCPGTPSQASPDARI